MDGLMFKDVSFGLRPCISTEVTVESDSARVFVIGGHI